MRARVLISTVICALVASGCAWSGGEDTSGPDTTEGNAVELNMEEAAHHADSVLGNTVNAIDPPVEWHHLRTAEATCSDDPRGLPYETGAVTRGRAVMTVVAPDRRSEMVDQVMEFWESEGISTHRVEEHPGYPSLDGGTEDEFRLLAAFNADGQLQLTMVSPCFEEVPVTPATGGWEDLGEVRAQTPDVHSDYWSR